MDFTLLDDKICHAMELAESNRRFYANAARSCPGGMGRDVYDQFGDEERDHLERLRRARQDLSGGDDKACRLAASWAGSHSEAYNRLSARYTAGTVCPPDASTVDAALALESRTLAFYEDWSATLGGPAGPGWEAERTFVAGMADEARGHMRILRGMRRGDDGKQGG